MFGSVYIEYLQLTADLPVYCKRLVQEVAFLDDGTSRMIKSYHKDVKNNGFTIFYRFQLFWKGIFLQIIRSPISTFFSLDISYLPRKTINEGCEFQKK